MIIDQQSWRQLKISGFNVGVSVHCGHSVAPERSRQQTNCQGGNPTLTPLMALSWAARYTGDICTRSGRGSSPERGKWWESHSLLHSTRACACSVGPVHTEHMSAMNWDLLFCILYFDQLRHVSSSTICGVFLWFLVDSVKEVGLFSLEVRRLWESLLCVSLVEFLPPSTPIPRAALL